MGCLIEFYESLTPFSTKMSFKILKELVNLSRRAPAKFSYEATRFFIAEKLLSFFLFTAIRRSSTQLKISLNPNLLSIQALFHQHLRFSPERSMWKEAKAISNEIAPNPIIFFIFIV
jgi:hypothetical protein